MIFINILPKNLAKKMALLTKNKAKIMQHLDHSIVF
jgi:hypothetical protein